MDRSNANGFGHRQLPRTNSLHVVQAISDSLDVPGSSAQSDHFQAVVRMQGNWRRGDDFAVMCLLKINQPVHQVAIGDAARSRVRLSRITSRTALDRLADPHRSICGSSFSRRSELTTIPTRANSDTSHCRRLFTRILTARSSTATVGIGCFHSGSTTRQINETPYLSATNTKFAPPSQYTLSVCDTTNEIP
jgi:hypothetical protein